MTTRERIRPLVGYLYSLVGNGRLDRGALAALRRGAGEKPGTAADMFPLVEPRLPEQPKPSDEEADAAYRVAALFALYHQGASRVAPFPDREPKDNWQDRSFGASLRMAARGDGNDLDTGIERRFLALLDARPEDLDPHLRGLFTLMKARRAETPVDWYQLYEDLANWGNEDRSAQKRWAQGFWRGTAASTTTNDIAGDGTSDSEEKEDV